MNRTTKIALVAASVAAIAATASFAQGGFGRHGDRMSPIDRLEAADADKSGDVTLDEFAKAFDQRIGGADANADGVYTADEIAAEIERQRAMRMANRIIERFDADGDGKLTKAEVENHQKKMFAMLDRNDDGKIVRDELPQRGFGKHHGWGHMGHGGMGGPLDQ